MAEEVAKVRLDKWLWAARFFRTRSLAKQAIEGGKVFYEGQRSKVSKEVQVGALLQIRQGWDDREVRVLALSDSRRGAAEASLLYEETEDSIRRRALAAARRAAEPQGLVSDHRPSKKERRQIHRFKHQFDEASDE